VSTELVVGSGNGAASAVTLNVLPHRLHLTRFPANRSSSLYALPHAEHAMLMLIEKSPSPREGRHTLAPLILTKKPAEVKPGPQPGAATLPVPG
jgi:hypothetical protein